MCITVYYVFTYLYAMLSMCQSFYKVKVKKAIAYVNFAA
ncbi:hypothetical protein T12_16270 [Trichinella patagoniensis]|uniref:Uncharacterized protein n=1 Tax=Trichinella patagoniensis TaxID=990121 RepID=A0A0V0YVQ9_9BILA|nr:hypothetical protein T12_13330 [Trichinella patagoniensis]KRY04221.1 hypothetical protein T12_16270 [Trichinella patagoniensis]